jgi:YbbR domain-containing protein
MKNFLSRNLGLKILSLLIAVLLFSAAPDRDVNLRKVFTVPLQILGADALEDRGLILNNPTELQTVRITLRGLGGSLQNTNAQDIQAKIDLSEVESAGVKKMSVRVDGLEPNVSLEQPEVTVDVDIKELISKTVPLEVTFPENMQEDFTNRYIEQSLDKAVLRGPEPLVDSIAQGIVLVMADVAQSEDGYINKSLPIQWMDEKGRPVSSEILKTSAQYMQVTIYPEKVMPVHVNLQGDVAEGYRITDMEVFPDTVRICGEPQVLAQMDQIETRAVDVQGLTVDKSVIVGFSDYIGVYIGPGQPDSVNVTVRVEALASRTFEISDTADIELVNLPDGLRASIQDESVSVTLRGLSTVLDSITENMLYVEVDMSDARRGTHKYALSIRDVPEGAGEVSFDPAEVSVKVTSS